MAIYQELRAAIWGVIHSRTMRQVCIPLLTTVLVSALSPISIASAQPASLRDAIQNSRSDLEVREGNLGGRGAAILQSATSHSCYVFLGEDHGIAEVPEFANGLLSDLAHHGTDTLALEVSPSIAKQLSLELASTRPDQTFADFLRDYPTTVPFYNTKEEFEFLQHAKARIGPSFNLIGFDQEFLGAPKLLLKQVGNEALTDDLRKQLGEFLRQEQQAETKAAHSGKPEDLFLFSADDAKLQAFATRLKSSGFDSVPVDDLLASRHVYEMFARDNYRSNEMRDVLMKRNFVRMHGDTPPCGILFKAGSNHGFRGIGPLNTRELGNFLAERSDPYSNGGVHILIVGGTGESLEFQAVAAPMKAKHYDALSDGLLKPLKPFLEVALAHKAWSLFDLTVFRSSFETSPDLGRFIYGYDFLVVVPHPTASHEILDAKQGKAAENSRKACTAINE